ncbi:MAG: ABC transporter substrate-binding protein [Peptococcaceae bacterium]|nr:ABC transporter substrate-binding protein [Peptococcaceae bacterium]
MRKPGILLLLAILIIAALTGSFYAYRFLRESLQKHETVRIAESQPAVHKLPHYLAVKKQFYKEQKIKIKTVDCRDDREALAALESRKADVALVKSSSLVFKKSSTLREGTGPVALASLDRGTCYHLVSREDKPLADIKSLKNKTVIAGPPDSQETVFLEHILREEDLGPYENVTIITNIPDEIKMGALKAGTGHFLLLEEKDLPAALARGFFIAKSFKTDFPTYVCVTTREYMRDHPAALQGVVNALYMAQIWLKYHDAGETAAAVHGIPGTDKETFARLVERYYISGSLPQSPVPPENNMEIMVKMLEKAREIPMPVRSGDLISVEFARNSVNSVRYVPEDKQEKKGLQRLKFW